MRRIEINSGKLAGIFLCLLFVIAAPLHANEQLYLQKAAEQKQKNNYTKANYYYFKILSKQENSAEARYGIAHSFQHLRQNDRALIEVNKLLQFVPNHEQGLILRALLNTQSENWDSVLSDTERVTQLNPLNEHAYIYMEFAYSGLGDKDAAINARKHYQQLTAGNQQ